MTKQKKKYDTSEPILVLIRRGRKGRGFSVAPVEDATNPAMCQSTEEVGEVIKEMLDDEGQARVDLKDLFSVSSGDASSDDDDYDDDDYDDDDDREGDDEDDEEEEDTAAGTIFEGVAGAADPTDRLLLNVFTKVVKKGQDLSSKPRKKRNRTRARRPRKRAK